MVQAPGQLENLASSQAFQVFAVKLGQRRERFLRIMDEAPDQPFFGVFHRPERRQLARRDGRPPADGCLPDLGPDHILRDPRLVCNPVGELVPGGRVRYPRGHRQHSAEKLPAAVVLSEIEARSRPIQQVL